jgi:hypothetical protein
VQPSLPPRMSGTASDCTGVGSSHLHIGLHSRPGCWIGYTHRTARRRLHALAIRPTRVAAPPTPGGWHQIGYYRDHILPAINRCFGCKLTRRKKKLKESANPEKCPALAQPPALARPLRG